MSAHDTDNLTLISNRVTSYPHLALLNIVGITANLWIVLAYGATANTAAKLAVVLSIVSVALLSSLPVRSLFSDIDALRRDAASQGASGAYARELASKPIPLFTGLTVGFNVLVAIVQIWALYSV